MRIFLTLLGVFFAQSSVAKIPLESLIVNTPKSAVVHEIITYLPKPGHHFNLKAPQLCDKEDLALKQPLQIQCQFTNPGVKKVLLNVCDDAESFCKPERLNITVTAPRGYKGNKKIKRQNVIYKPKSKTTVPKGFLQNDARGAQRQAKKKNQLLFLNFSANWCPACNLLEEHVYNKITFQEASKELVKIKLDVDSDVSWQWKEHFRVGGYPTIIIANSKLEEIDRIVGYRPLDGMVSWINKTKVLKDQPLNTVEAEIQKSPTKSKKQDMLNKRARVGRWYYERQEYEKAISYLEDLPAPTSKKLFYLSSIELTKDSDKKIKLYERLLTEFPLDIYYTDWLLTVAKWKVDKVVPYLKGLDKNIEHWETSPDLQDQELSLGDLYQLQGWLFGFLKNAKKSQERYVQCANFYKTLSEKSKLKVARGSNLERAYCLLKAGKTKEAVKLYETMVTEYQSEFAFNFYYARALKTLGNHKKALTFAKKAYENSYGDNLLRATALKAKIEISLNNKIAAKQTIQKTLKNVYMPKSQQIRSHSYLTQIKDILKEI